MNNYTNKALLAVEAMDWIQPALNESPPCFHISEDGRFCGRAERWDGHKKLKKFPALHAFVSFKRFIAQIRDVGMVDGMEDACKIIAPQNPFAHSANADVRGQCQAQIRKAIEVFAPKILLLLLTLLSGCAINDTITNLAHGPIDARSEDYNEPPMVLHRESYKNVQ